MAQEIEMKLSLRLQLVQPLNKDYYTLTAAGRSESTVCVLMIAKEHVFFFLGGVLLIIYIQEKMQ